MIVADSLPLGARGEWHHQGTRAQPWPHMRGAAHSRASGMPSKTAGAARAGRARPLTHERGRGVGDRQTSACAGQGGRSSACRQGTALHPRKGRGVGDRQTSACAGQGGRSSACRFSPEPERSVGAQSSQQSWRRERDSNPREARAPTRFPVVPVRPLRHLSVGTAAGARRARPIGRDGRVRWRGALGERYGGESGIRTHGRSRPLQRFSRPPPSSAQPSLRAHRLYVAPWPAAKPGCPDQAPRSSASRSLEGPWSP